MSVERPQKFKIEVRGKAYMGTTKRELAQNLRKDVAPWRRRARSIRIGMTVAVPIELLGLSFLAGATGLKNGLIALATDLAANGVLIYVAKKAGDTAKELSSEAYNLDGHSTL